MQCLREGQVPPNHVVVKFIYPDSGATLVHERDLILKDRTTMVGDVVKRKSSDAQSGMVIKTSMTCTLEPIYNGLPYHGSGPWDYLPQDNLLKVPVEDIQFLDYEPGDRIIYNDWMGEIVDVYEDVSVRLGNGSVVKVEDPDALEIPDCIYRDDLAPRPSLIAALKKGRQRRKGIHAVNSKDENTEPPQSFYPGQSILTTKANLRLGHWVIGSYTPSEPPRGVVVDVRVSSLRMEWICTKLYDKERENMDMPPITLEFPELEEIKVFNKTNLASTVNGASSQYGSRHGNDVSAGDIVKFRDVSGAAVKYSEQSPDRSKTGVFRRIPRLITQGFDMNTFQVKETDTRALIQWQDGTITEEDSNSILPYINVDDHDVWIGEIVSLRSAEEKCDGLIHLKEVGVVQSVDAIERIARVKWFDGFVTSILEERPSTLITETSAGSLSDRESSVALFDIIAYPALTKRRGDLVVLAPFDSALTTSSPEEVSEALRTGKTPYVTSEGALENMQDLQDVLSRTSIRWFGEVVDLGLDGLLTIRLGALDQPEDIRVSVQRVSVAVGGDDYDSESEASSSNDYLSWSAAEEPEPISETVEYEGGQPIESGAEDDWMTDEAEDHSDADEEKDKVHVNGNIEVDGDVEMEDAPTELDAPAKVKPDNGHQMLETNAERANQNPPPLDSQALQPSTQYHFSRLSSMPTQFEILEGDAYAGHVFAGTISKFSATFLRRVRKEHAMLENNLPEGIWIKTWDDRLDLLRVLILGPRGTPYELAPFLLDFKLDDNFPASPPLVHFHSWTYGLGRINPNLYEGLSQCYFQKTAG